MTLGEKLRQAREERGLTLREAEDRSGVSNGYISQIESGSVKQPSPQRLHALAQAYGIDYRELMVMAGHVPVEAGGGLELPPGLAFDRLSDLTDFEVEKVNEYVQLIRNARGIDQ